MLQFSQRYHKKLILRLTEAKNCEDKIREQKHEQVFSPKNRLPGSRTAQLNSFYIRKSTKIDPTFMHALDVDVPISFLLSSVQARLKDHPAWTFLESRGQRLAWKDLPAF